MKNEKLQQRLADEILDFIDRQRSLMLATLDAEGMPYASYAPFAIGDSCLYVLLSEIALHALNLQQCPRASVLIIEDEGTAEELFARLRVNYVVDAECIPFGAAGWSQGIGTLTARHGERIGNLSQLSDFKLFRLVPRRGRYVKGFGRAYALEGASLTGETLDHMRDGHKTREAV